MDPQNTNPNQPIAPVNPNPGPVTPIEPVGGAVPIGGVIGENPAPATQPYDPLAPTISTQPAAPVFPTPFPSEPSLPQPPALPSPIDPMSTPVAGESGWTPQQPQTWSPPPTDQSAFASPGVSPDPVQETQSPAAGMPGVAGGIQPEPAIVSSDPYSGAAQPAIPNTSPDQNTPGFNLSNGVTPPWVAQPANSSEPPSPTAPDTVPTDLSHLVDNSAMPVVGSGPVIAQPETVVVPSAPDPNQAVANTSSKGFPKVLLIVAGLVLILVAGASAYFILGVGKPEENIPGGSLPAQTTIPTPEQTVPTAEPTLVPGSEGSSSATFGNVNGSGSANLKASPTPAGGTSAIDLLRRRTISPTPTQSLP